MMDQNTLSRRTFVMAAGFAGFAVAAPGAPAVLPGAQRADGLAGNQGIVKMLASLDGTAAPWWFAGYLYGMQAGRRAVPMVRCEGCEIYFPKRLPNGDYLLAGATLTFFRDVASGEWSDSLLNPITGRRNTIKTNVLGSKANAGFLYPADGSSSYMVGEMGSTGQLNYRPPERPASQPRGELKWEHVGDTMFVTSSRSIDTPAQPWLEVSSSFAHAADLKNPSKTTVAANGSVTYASPWLKWMEMDDVPGHLMWHAATHKLRGLDELPQQYLARAKALGLLNVLNRPPDTKA